MVVALEILGVPSASCGSCVSDLGLDVGASARIVFLGIYVIVNQVNHFIEVPSEGP